MKEITINKKSYHLNDDEFEVDVEKSEKFSPMVIRKDVSTCDREIGLLKKLSSKLNLNELFCAKVKFGGYIPLNLLNVFPVININCDKTSTQTIGSNLTKYDTQNKIRVMRYNNSMSIEYELSVENEIAVVITTKEENFDNMNKVLYCEKFLYVSSLIWTEFKNHFNQWLVQEGESIRLVYDNLINLLIMVKDAGDDFREILKANKQYVDKWTILDTGSSDNTISIIRDVFSHMEGNLYEEPFINFRDSRNRLFELAGDECAFNIMIDDSYVLNGNLREFLDTARGDDKADSFSLFIADNEIEYSSNRITKPERKLKYKYKIHEIIEENENLCIPREIAWIQDIGSPYMIERTTNRKQKDIELLEEELRENPDDPRNLYYMAETYYCLKDWQNAFRYYKLRSESNKGFDEETYDSLFKMALISERHFQTSWEEVEKMYVRCFEADKTGPTPLFMIGYHYLLNGNNRLAYDYFKQVMSLPKTHKNMNTRPIIFREYAPKFLLSLCFEFEDYELGFMCTEILLQNFKGDFHFLKWKNVFTLFLLLKQEQNSIPESEVDLPKLEHNNKKLICFVDNSGWENWDGETLQTKGLGGSETWTIEYAQTLASRDAYEVIVFCRCEDVKVHNNVSYIPIQNFIKFALSNVIDVCLVSRYSEYLFLCSSKLFTISKLYFVLHDIGIPGDMIPVSDKLSGILCISEWQKEQFLSLFKDLNDKTHVISYGIEKSDYQLDCKQNNYSFIYPSFPNRGLLYLLRMFPKIVERYPTAKLNVFCNFELDYLKPMKEEMDEIQSLIQAQSANVVNHGWVNRETLNRYWSEADIWFYPCVFPETCCRVAIEAAASKTFVICNDLAGLNDTVGKRGAIIPGDPRTEEWQNIALTNLFFVLDNKLENIFIERNYEWVQTKSYSNVVSDFENRFLSQETKQESGEIMTWVETKLRNIQSTLTLDYGSFEEEYPDQLMACAFINGTENVLEIGGNIGRNSLIIASILNKNNNTNFVSMECNLSIADQLEHNKNKNNLEFSIEKCALSKRNLIQKPGEWQTYVSNVVLSGYNSVKTITWTNLCKKYSFTFDTLVLDCEGAFYYILKDMPEILTNINKIIMENDYMEILHKNYIDGKLQENGFNLVYSKPADESVNMPCKDFFYQVWIKG